MNQNDRFGASSVRGRIVAHWASRVPRTVEYPADILRTHNTLSYAAADVLAAAYGGDTRRVPKYIGFIYGTNESPALGPISRAMSLESIRTDIEAINKGNMLVVRFSRPPSILSQKDFQK